MARDLVDVLLRIRVLNNEDSFKYLDELKLDDEELRIVIDARYPHNTAGRGLAYRRYGQRLIPVNYRNLVEAVIESRADIPISVEG